jgi:hypothetical protein
MIVATVTAIPKSKDEDLINFIHSHPGMALAFVSFLCVIIALQYKNGKQLKKERRSANVKTQEVQMDALTEIINSHAELHEKSINELTSITSEFKLTLKETTTEFRDSVNELHTRITEVATSHAALLSDHTRMLEICPIAHGQQLSIDHLRTDRNRRQRRERRKKPLKVDPDK